ncbi:hypothetical protein B0F88_104152 [Methylobacter tundripaludum]|uniref:Uncharacterized protein n=1 Tax=Methylobacter tundripaludum TaxID=173365 RepID=A0A2S6H4D6_9GAMM|nr:hypothetical protein [Methylobacter tundripaludum]PPK72358.1 hypothetical protein B0F88_104152 [Methylobacter tundripaludum]
MASIVVIISVLVVIVFLVAIAIGFQEASHIKQAPTITDEFVSELAARLAPMLRKELEEDSGINEIEPQNSKESSSNQNNIYDLTALISERKNVRVR